MVKACFSAPAFHPTRPMARLAPGRWNIIGEARLLVDALEASDESGLAKVADLSRDCNGLIMIHNGMIMMKMG